MSAAVPPGLWAERGLQTELTYDIHEIIDLIVDDGDFFEFKEDFAPNLVLGLARFDSMTGNRRVAPRSPRGRVEENPT